MEKMARYCIECGQNISKQPIYENLCYSCKKYNSENMKYIREVGKRALKVLKREGNNVIFTKNAIAYKGTLNEYIDVVKREVYSIFDFNNGIGFFEFVKVDKYEIKSVNHLLFQKEDLSKEAEIFKLYFSTIIGVATKSPSEYIVVKCDENYFVIKLLLKEKSDDRFGFSEETGVVKQLGYFSIPYACVNFITTDDEVVFVRGLEDVEKE